MDGLRISQSRSLALTVTPMSFFTATWKALGLEARSRALTTSGPEAEEHYREAITHRGASLIAGEAASAHLLYGE